MLAIIDYGMGNLRSVSKALEASGAKEVKVVSQPKEILKADKIVLPGVGAMAEAISALRKLNLIEPIKESIFRKPFLGICLGLQLLFTESEEGGRVKGLGIFKGKVKRFSGRLKVPHMGWNQIRVKSSYILRNIPDNSYFYFCHSYYVVPEDKSIIASNTDYGLEFVSSISKDNLFACQFHPEKSQAAGLRLLKNFVRQ
ncbi:imidazole glycerol phosphate synthase subunit HisH [bacterium]|nr:MAG: imidazole glycerol phosphate synthase subunit HisH [bacterium]